MSAAPQWQTLLDSAPRAIRRDFALRCKGIAAIDAAPTGRKARTAKVWARRIGIRWTTLISLRSEFRRRGPIALLDKSWSSRCWSAPRENAVPAPAIEYLKSLAAEGRLTQQEAIRAFLCQLKRWRKGDASAAVPGWSTPPAGDRLPGCSARNLARYLPPAPRPLGKVRFEYVTRVYYSGKIVTIKRKPTA